MPNATAIMENNRPAKRAVPRTKGIILERRKGRGSAGLCSGYGGGGGGGGDRVNEYGGGASSYSTSGRALIVFVLVVVSVVTCGSRGGGAITLRPIVNDTVAKTKKYVKPMTLAGWAGEKKAARLIYCAVRLCWLKVVLIEAMAARPMSYYEKKVLSKE